MIMSKNNLCEKVKTKGYIYNMWGGHSKLLSPILKLVSNKVECYFLFIM